MSFELFGGQSLIISWPDVVGTIGVVNIIAAYLLLQAEKLKFNDYSYLWLNAIGSALITVSLFYSFNLASFIIECFWLTISAYGLVKHYVKPV